jgi:hypothetical protein
MAAAESLVDLQDTYNEKEDDIASLPSTASDSDDYSDADSDAQAEWDRSLEQLQLLLTMMIVPWMGKYFGRKFAYWSKSSLCSHSQPYIRIMAKAPCIFSRRLLLTEQHQVGVGTWSGCTELKYGGRTRKPSRLSV